MAWGLCGEMIDGRGSNKTRGIRRSSWVSTDQNGRV